jgi:hypothetical protein
LFCTVTRHFPCPVAVMTPPPWELGTIMAQTITN